MGYIDTCPLHGTPHPPHHHVHEEWGWWWMLHRPTGTYWRRFIIFITNQMVTTTITLLLMQSSEPPKGQHYHIVNKAVLKRDEEICAAPQWVGLQAEATSRCQPLVKGDDRIIWRRTEMFIHARKHKQMHAHTPTYCNQQPHPETWHRVDQHSHALHSPNSQPEYLESKTMLTDQKSTATQTKNPNTCIDKDCWQKGVHTRRGFALRLHVCQR